MPRVKVVSPSDGNLRALAVCRLRDSTLVAFFPVDSSESASIRATIGKVLEANAHGVHPRLTITDREHGQIHYETDNMAMWIAVTSSTYPQRVAFRAIAEMRARFNSALSDALDTAREGGLSRSARPMMSELCTRFADENKNDRVLSVMKQVEEVRGVMGESITALLHNNETIEVLEDRAEGLKEQARTFQKTSRVVAQVQKRQNKKLLSYMCVILVVLGVVVAAPFVMIYWADIIAFLGGALPPGSNATAADGSSGGDAGSGDDAGSGAFGADSNASAALGEALLSEQLQPRGARAGSGAVDSRTSRRLAAWLAELVSSRAERAVLRGAG